MLGRAQKNKLIKIRVHNIRDYAKDKHRVTDDTAYGGISGMVMKVEPIYRAVRDIKISSSKKQAPSKSQKSKSKTRIILLSAKGKVLTQSHVRTLAKYDQIILIAGHYKGVDERVAKYIADEELSIGDYVITGGELPAMIVVDAVSRMIKGVIGKEASKEGESFSKGVKYEHGVYTRPEVFSPPTSPKASKGKARKVEWRVPEVLVSGNHKKIEEWREKQRTIMKNK
jgi:tRNA (guanine37-N1)-methyltransferase